MIVTAAEVFLVGMLLGAALLGAAMIGGERFGIVPVTLVLIGWTAEVIALGQGTPEMIAELAIAIVFLSCILMKNGEG